MLAHTQMHTALHFPLIHVNLFSGYNTSSVEKEKKKMKKMLYSYLCFYDLIFFIGFLYSIPCESNNILSNIQTKTCNGNTVKTMTYNILYVESNT